MANSGSAGHARPGRYNNQAVNVNTPPLAANIHTLYCANVTKNGRLAKSDAEIAPRPSVTSKIGRAQQISVVEEANSTSQAHRLGAVASSVACTLTVRVVGVIVGRVAQLVRIVLMLVNRTSRRLLKRSVGKTLVEEQFFQLCIGEGNPTIRAHE